MMGTIILYGITADGKKPQMTESKLNLLFILSIIGLIVLSAFLPGCSITKAYDIHAEHVSVVIQNKLETRETPRFSADMDSGIYRHF